MTELELRKKHNEEAIKAVAAVRNQMYPGMLLSVEANEDCLSGKGIVATTDDIYSAIPMQFRYSPHMMARSKSNGEVEAVEAAQPIPTISRAVKPEVSPHSSKKVALRDLL